jgi:hypothetical protein
MPQPIPKEQFRGLEDERAEWEAEGSPGTFDGWVAAEREGALEDLEVRVNGKPIAPAVKMLKQDAPTRAVAPAQQARRNLSGSRPAGSKSTGGKTRTAAHGPPERPPRSSDDDDPHPVAHREVAA